MIQKKKILAIIPARGGSKRVPKKNIRLLTGKPLIAYTIETALKSRYLNRIVVSTEDEEIARISKKYGAEVIKRPKILAADKAKTVEAVFHVLKVLTRKKYIPDLIILLQPTSPLRTVDDIDKAINIFLQNKCESVVSVCEMEPSPYRFFGIKEKYLKLILGRKNLLKRSQDLPKIYVINGALYISTPKIIRKYKSFYSSKILPYIMPKERSVDIDDEIEFKLAEIIIKNERNKNRK